MLRHYVTTKIPGTAADGGGGGVAWTSVNNAKVEDGILADCGIVGPGGGGGFPNQLKLTNFNFGIPPGAVIDGIYVEAKVQTTGGVSGNDDGFVNLIYNGGATDTSDTPNPGIAWSSTLNWITHGDNSSLWGREWTAAEINHSDFGVALAAFPGTGTADIHVDAVQITVYWHIELSTAPADVPTRVAYKVYSRDGDYLGELPAVSSPFAFPQDINSAGSSIEITCGIKAENEVTVDALLTDDDDEILTDNDLPILASNTEIMISEGASNNNAIFKNSNRVAVWMYNYWYPNGKLMFSGQVNKVTPKYAGGSSYVKLLVYSDGLDLNNLIARGYPFTYTTDVSQTSQNGYVTSSVVGGKGAGWNVYGQSFIVGAGVTNIGAITLKLQGSATVSVSLYDNVNGNLLGTASKVVSAGSATDIQFEFPSLIDVTAGGTYFFAVWVDPGQSIKVYKHGTSSTYADGSMYNSNYAGSSGGGSFAAVSGDFYFITKYGTPTTTTTYSSQDPVTGMMSGILADYNNRGGYITERDFEATGLSLTYTFAVAFIYDALKKVLDMSPAGFYSYIDLGTAEIDILQESETADFTVVRGKDIVDLELSLSIENVKNYLLFTGGDTGGGTNLYRDYSDAESNALYGLRTEAKTDNRVTLNATANAIGDSFIAENSEETQETSLIVPVTAMDHTLLIPGKTIGFRNFGNFIDSMVLQIVRREFNTKTVTLTLGRLPVRMSDEIQRINRGLLNEQTIGNPSAPS